MSELVRAVVFDAWINRSGAHPDVLGYTPVARLGKLTELPAKLTGSKWP